MGVKTEKPVAWTGVDTKNGGGFISKSDGYLNFRHKCEKCSVDTTNRTQVAVPPDRRPSPSKNLFHKLISRAAVDVYPRRKIKKWYPLPDTTSPMRDFSAKFDRENSLIK